MFIQIENTSKKRKNLARVASKSAIFTKIKELGWKLADCKFTELQDDLVTKKYNELDGRMNQRGKQFAQRAGL
jgi:hypothetical protein